MAILAQAVIFPADVAAGIEGVVRMAWIIELLKTFWKPIAGLLAGFLVLFQRWRIKRKDELIDRQEQVIRGHEAKEDVHRQDEEINANTEKQIDDMRRIVNHARNQEEAAREVSGALNEYFGGGDKK